MRRSLFIIAAVLLLGLGLIVAGSALGSSGMSPTGQSAQTLTPSAFVPLVLKPEDTPTPTATATATTPPAPALESFENVESAWVVGRDTANGGVVDRSSSFAAAGMYSAHAQTQGTSERASVYVSFFESAANHQWQERPGTWFWQRASLYLPSSTVAQLGPSEYLTLAGLWPTGGGAGWWLRIRQGGELYVFGYNGDGAAREFRVYGVFPQDQWVELEVGLHSQNGPGVKRAFAFLIDGDFYGWYHQGRMTSETYNRAAMGILSTNSSDLLDVYIDEWRATTSAGLPGGPDHRSPANVQEQDYRLLSGVQWQIDWSTWGNDLRLAATHGLYSANSRLQSGRNLDRMPDLTSGWAEIEIGWPGGTPPTAPSSYFGPMVGFRKEINREENLEVIPIGYGGGNVKLTLEAWVHLPPNGDAGPIILADWQMPLASIGGGSRIPEPGDIIRARWEQINATQLNVRASYYDASASTWHTDIINYTFNDTSVGSPAVNFTDGNHKASSITIDSTSYSIRRFKVGTLDTYP